MVYFRRFRVFCLIGCLAGFGAGCDAPSSGFFGVPKLQRSLEGTTFSLRFNGPLVEAIRTSPDFLPVFSEVAWKAALLVEAERPTCAVKWIEGDPAMMWLGLACDGAKPPPRIKRAKTLFCDIDDLSARGGFVTGGLTCS